MFPWNQFKNIQEYVHQLLNIKPNEIDEFVKKIIEENIQYTPSSKTNEKSKNSSTNTILNQQTSPRQKQKSQGLEPKVFESLEDVFVQFHIKNKQSLQGGKIFYNSNQLILKDIPNIGDEHKVILPALVQQRGAKLHYKQGVLQIKIPKADDIQFTEIDIHL